MPTEYLAPGVYVEEISSGPRPIEGVPTSTAGFVGAARYGPVRLAPAALSSLAEFERSYLPFGAAGGALQFEGGADSSDFLWHAVRAFFAEGGRRLYVSRVFKPRAGGDAPDDRLHCDGHARVDASRTGGVQIRARYPGAAGNLRVGLALRGGAEALVAEADPATGVPRTTLRSVTDLDLVWLHRRDAPDPAAGALHLARRDAKQASWRLEPGNGGDHVDVANLTVGAEPGAGDSVRRVALQVSLHSGDGLQDLAAWVDLPIDPRHAADSVFARFAEAPAKAADARNLPLVFACTAELRTAFDVLAALGLGEWRPAGDAGDPPSADDPPGLQLALEGGNDGMRPDAAAFEGGVDPKTGAAHGLAQFEAIDEIALVAAPGSSCRYGAGWRENADAIADLLDAHATRLRYRFALLDSAEGQTIAEVRALRARFDTSHAALYYPWIMVPDPLTAAPLQLPPSGFVAGICARSAAERGVHKAPANEVVRLAIGLETSIGKSVQEVLNPEGINCFRAFAGRGIRLWGARTASSDPVWKYVNLRRYFAYVEHSIDKGTQWAVFEPNGETLWASVRRVIESFLLAEWRGGALVGDSAKEAFFVECDRTTMTQDDLDNGRLICLVGMAPLRPAEFVIFRIGQWTAERKD